MRVLVDTCIGSLTLRGVTTESMHVQVLRNLFSENRVYLIGPIRQEIWFGISQKQQFSKPRNTLSVFPDLLIQTNDYECAAEYSNLLRKKGIQGSAIDF